MVYYNNDLNKEILKGLKLYKISTVQLSRDNIIRHEYTYTNNLNIINDYIRENQNEDEVYTGHYYENMKEEDMFRFLQRHKDGLNKCNLKQLRELIIKDATVLNHLPIKFNNYEPEYTYNTVINTPNGTLDLGEDKFKFYYYNNKIIIDNEETISIPLIPATGYIIDVSCDKGVMNIYFNKK